MPRYLVETYLGRTQSAERTAREERARSAAADLTRERALVHFDHSIHVPEDEICFYVFEAGSAADAEDAANRAGLGPIRVVEAIASQKEET
ncbi:MAG TPA: hypothetical protein VFK22_02650 [Candidatus Dormibacteraeota bacterium]|nr:hypothetical protein [Candidatus Dormibacteraeota bacterium]